MLNKTPEPPDVVYELMVTLTLDWEGSAKGLPEHRMSVDVWMKALSELQRCIRRKATNMLVEQVGTSWPTRRYLTRPLVKVVTSTRPTPSSLHRCPGTGRGFINTRQKRHNQALTIRLAQGCARESEALAYARPRR